MVEYFKLLFRSWKYRLVDNPAEIRYLLHTIKRGTIVMDVGAHKGGYTFWMRKAVGPQGKVIAFEPQSSGARLLNQLYKRTNVQVEHLSLSDSIGQQKLYILPQAYKVSFEASLTDKYKEAVTEMTDTTTIDYYCQEHGLSPSFIKIDVEGHEEKVLQGAVKVLQESRPVVLVECEVRHSEQASMDRLFRWLKDLRYSGFFYKAGVRHPIEEFDPLKDQRTHLAGTKHYINNFYFEPIHCT